MPVYRLEQLVGQPVLLQQVPELAYRRLVRRRRAPQIDADKPAHGRRVVQRLLDRPIAQRVPLLQEVDAQHPLQTHRAPTAFARALG